MNVEVEHDGERDGGWREIVFGPVVAGGGCYGDGAVEVVGRKLST